MPNYPPGFLVPPTPDPLPTLPSGAAGAAVLSTDNGGVWKTWNGTAWASMPGIRGQAIFNGFSGSNPVPIAASATAVGAINSTQATVSTGFTQPDVARSIDIAFPAQWNGGNLTIHGTDGNSNPVTQLYVKNPGNTVLGTVAFKSVTSVTNSATGADTHNATLATGSLIFLPYFNASGAFAPATFAIMQVFYVNLNTNAQGWYFVGVTTPNAIDLLAGDGIPAGITPDGNTIYFVITGN